MEMDGMHAYMPQLSKTDTLLPSHELLIEQLNTLTKTVNKLKVEVKNYVELSSKHENEISKLKEQLNVISSQSSNSDESNSDYEETLTGKAYSLTRSMEDTNKKTPIPPLQRAKTSFGGESDFTNLSNEMDASSLVSKEPGLVWPKILNMNREMLYEFKNNYDEWLIHPSALEFHDIIGRGSSALVYQGTYKGEQVAIKVFNFNPMDKESFEKQEKELHEEVNVLMNVKSEHVVKFYGIVLKPAICIVMEFCERRSLYDILSATGRLSWSHTLRIFREIILGVVALHSSRPQIVHRDLKTLNILVTKTLKIKVADFGLSRLTDRREHYSTLCKLRGTHAYCAPEVYNGEQFTVKADIYSLGIILWELVSKCIKGEYKRPFEEYPWINYSFQIVIQTAKNGLRPVIPPCPPRIRDLICLLWNYDPEKRPNCIQLLASVREIEKIYHSDKDAWLVMCSQATEYKDVQAPPLKLPHSLVDNRTNQAHVPKNTKHERGLKWMVKSFGTSKDKKKDKKKKNTPQFENLLIDIKTYKSFEAHLVKEMSEEYLLFWKEITLFEKVHPSDMWLEKAKEIHKNFIENEVVGIDPNQKSIIGDKLSNEDVNSQLFVEVRFEVESILKTKFLNFTHSI